MKEIESLPDSPNIVLPDMKNNIFTFYESLIELLNSGYASMDYLKDYKDIDIVVLIYLDGVGFEPLKSRLPRRLRDKVIKITSIYPATTASIVTSLVTLSPPARHCVLEWNLYVPELDLLIEPLPMRSYHSGINDELCFKGISPGRIIRSRRLFPKLVRKGIKVVSFLRGYIVSHCYSKYIFHKVKVYPYINLTDLSFTLKNAILEERERSLYYVYVEGIDSIGHLYGSESPQYSIDLRYTIRILLNYFSKIKDSNKDILFVFTSDHGMTDVKDGKVIFLDKVSPSIKKYIRKDKRGIPLVSGSPRNVYLHVKEECLDKVVEKLDPISQLADIVYKDELVKYLLKNPSSDAIDRIGDVIILPKPGYAVWYRHYKGEKFRSIGLHGGISPQEMYIPLLLLTPKEIRI